MLPLRPLLRPLEAFPFEENGDEFLLLRDPQKITPDVQVPRGIAPLLALCDGEHTVAQMAEATQGPDGQNVDPHLIERVLQQADECYLLESPRFEQFQREATRSYVQVQTRPAAFAGLSYPDEPHELSEFLQKKWDAAAQWDTQQLPGKLRGIIVPHIDFHRGGDVEALAWRVLGRESFDTIIALGIAHSGVRYPFCATLKDHETPFGTVRCDRPFVEALAKRVGPRLLAEESAHRQEHSLEFVAVFQEFVPSLRDAALVPIICGGFWEALKTGRSPAEFSDIATFCDALRDLVQEREAKGERVALVASVDGAHVGTQFGDPTKLTPARLEEIRREDSAFWHEVEAGNTEGLHAHLARDNNARNVDAHPAVWTLLHAFPELRAQMLHYNQAFDPRTNAVVSFASLALYEGA